MTDHPQNGHPAGEADLYRLLAENVLDYAVFVIDRDRNVRTWNPGAERLLGYSGEEILGESADRFFTPEDRAAGRPEAEVEQALATGRGDDDRWHVRKDGSRFWSGGVLTPLREPDGTVRGFAKLMRDRTDLKRAADVSAEALAYAESIVATVREPLVVLDAGLRVATANRSFYRTFEVSPGETEGRRIYDLGNGQWDIPDLRRLLDEILPRDSAFEDYEVEHEFEQIGRRSMLLNARKVYRPGNHSKLILLAIEDVTERRRLEAERREIETRFTSLVKNIRDHAVLTLSPEGRFTSWNVEAERILGFPEAEGVGLAFPAIFTPEDIEGGKPEWELRTAREEGRAEDERWHVRKNGERFWALGIVTPMHDADGRLVGYSKILRDMTDRKAAEDRCRFQSHLLDAVGQAVIAAAPDGAVRYWNKAAETLYGWSREEAVGRNVGDLVVAPESAARSAEIMARLGRGEGWSGEFTVRRKDGSTFPAYVTDAPIVGEDGRVEAIVGVSADLTQRRQTDAALRESEGRLRALTDNLPDGAIYQIVRDADGRNRFTFVSGGIERLFGVTPQAAVADPAALYSTIHADDRERLLAAEAEAQRGLKRFDCEFRHLMPDGEVRWVHARSAPRRLPDGGVVWEGVLTDATDRRRAEAALRASERRFRRLFEADIVGVGVSDGGGAWIEANDELLRMLGYGRDELEAGKVRWKDMTPERFLPLDERAIAEAAERGACTPYEKEYVRKDGSPLPVLIGYATLDEPDTFICLVLDLSARRKVEADLRRSEEHLRAIVEATPECVKLVAADGRLLQMNAAGLRMVEAEGVEAVAGACVYDLIVPEQRRAWAEFNARVCGGASERREFEIVGLKGSRRHMETHAVPVRMPDGTVAQLGVTRDVTERKGAEAAIKRLAGQFRTLAAAAATINSSLSKESVLQVVTEEARFIVGAHQAVSSLTGGERWAQSINTVSLSEKYAGHRAYDAEPDGSGIYSLVCRDNAPMRLTQAELVAHPAWRNFGGDPAHPPMRGWLAAPLVGRDGRNLGLIQLSDKDDGGEFTEQDEAILVQLAQTASVALENARLYDELRDADRRKDDFLAMLAHELRNPLAPIRSGLDLLRLEGRDSEVVEVMGEQVGHVVRLVDDLLDVSRILRGKVELRHEPTDLAAVLRRAAETVRPRTAEHGQRFAASLPGEPLPLVADPVRLTQVVTNLLHNASKYTEDGGEIRLEAVRDGGEAVVTVADSGIGIEAALLPKVFDLFTQADQALDRSQGGLGIGLTVVRSLVEMHGGRVSVASEGPGRGTKFTLRLPLAEATAVPAGDPPPEASPVPRRVLVVDDNAPAAKLLGRLLEKLGGHEVRTAHDGPTGLAAAAEFRPDLVLLDIGLPRMDGYEVARRLRERPEFGGLLVALTGYGTAEDRRRSLEAGFDDHLVKPPGVEMLRAVLAHPKLRVK